MLTSRSETSPQRHRYGSDPSQFADLHLPAGRRHPGTVVLIHGGWWGSRFGADHLAGVLDLRAAAREENGNGAAIELMGGDPGELPERYAVADPLSQVPIPAAVRCVHARADDRVPFAQSVTYVAAAQAAGQDARLLGVDGDHFSVADASSPTWPVVIKALEELLGTA